MGGGKTERPPGRGFVALAENGLDVGLEVRKIGGAHDDARDTGLGGDVA